MIRNVLFNPYVYLIVVVYVLVIMGVFYKVKNMNLFKPNTIIYHTPSQVVNYFKQININISVKDDFIKKNNGERIHYILISNNDFVSKKIFLFSHGNSGNIYTYYNCNAVLLLLRYGSVLIYDYSGYGLSGGHPSENNMKYDILAVWDFMVSRYYSYDIILFGESLGCFSSIWLMYCLTKYKPKKMPKSIILESGFYNVQRMVIESDHVLFKFFLIRILKPLFVRLVKNEFDNSFYVKYIKKYNPSFPILFLHSPDDVVINWKHSYDLAKQTKSSYHSISGEHGVPIFSNCCRDIVSLFIY